MREMTIGKNDAGQRLDKFLQKALPSLPPSLMHKYVRLKRIKCNGKRCQTSDQLTEGDVLSLYINDEFFQPVKEEEAFPGCTFSMRTITSFCVTSARAWWFTKTTRARWIP